MAADSATTVEMRALWVDAFGPGCLNTNQVKKLVQDCCKYNFNAVFVQMRRRGDAFYFPKLPNQDPRTSILAQDFDALAEIIKECHEANPRIEVHCWLCSHFAASVSEPPSDSANIYNRHPNWLTRSASGETLIGDRYFIDPGVPEAGQWIHDVAIDVTSRYDVDGLHWDYFRYPGPDSGYNPIALERYQREFGITNQPSAQDPQFSEWRRRQVTDFLRWTSADLLQIKPRLIISAAVFADYEDSANYRFADWVAWCREGLLDVAVPMDFSADNQNVFFPRAQFALKNQGIRAVYIGQAAYANSPANTVSQLKECREIGAKGTVLYSYRSTYADSQTPQPPGSSVSPGGVLIDNSSAEASGSWQSGKYGRFQGKDYLYRVNGSENDFVQFVPKSPAAGPCDIYEWHVAGDNRATDVPFEIVHANGTNVVKVNQQLDGSKWNYLGQFTLDTNSMVRITDAVTDPAKVVVADAIRFVPVHTNAVHKRTIEQIQDDEAGRQSGAKGYSREAFFELLKKQYQPTWVDTPQLPWKANPTNGIIKGRIVGGKRNSPLYNATVSLQGSTDRKQLTEPHGAFAFFEVPPGEYVISATANGFKFSKTSVRVQAGVVEEADLTLSP